MCYNILIVWCKHKHTDTNCGELMFNCCINIQINFKNVNVKFTELENTSKIYVCQYLQIKQSILRSTIYVFICVPTSTDATLHHNIVNQYAVTWMKVKWWNMRVVSEFNINLHHGFDSFNYHEKKQPFIYLTCIKDKYQVSIMFVSLKL